MATLQQRWLFNENENVQIIPYSTSNSIYHPRYYGNNSENNVLLSNLIEQMLSQISQNSAALAELNALIASGSIGGGGGGGFSGGVNTPHIIYGHIAALFNDSLNEYEVYENAEIHIDENGNIIVQEGEESV